MISVIYLCLRTVGSIATVTRSVRTGARRLTPGLIDRALRTGRSFEATGYSLGRGDLTHGDLTVDHPWATRPADSPSPPPPPHRAGSENGHETAMADDPRRRP